MSLVNRRSSQIGQALCIKVPSSAGRLQRLECGLQDRLAVVVVAWDLRDRDDHVEDLLEGKVATGLTRRLCSEQKRPPGFEYAGVTGPEHGGVGVGVLEELGGDEPLTGEVGVEAL
jgi:hypothetical protein